MLGSLRTDGAVVGRAARAARAAQLEDLEVQASDLQYLRQGQLHSNACHAWLGPVMHPALQ